MADDGGFSFRTAGRLRLALEATDEADAALDQSTTSSKPAVSGTRRVHRCSCMRRCGRAAGAGRPAGRRVPHTCHRRLPAPAPRPWWTRPVAGPAIRGRRRRRRRRGAAVLSVRCHEPRRADAAFGERRRPACRVSVELPECQPEDRGGCHHHGRRGAARPWTDDPSAAVARLSAGDQAGRGQSWRSATRS